MFETMTIQYVNSNRKTLIFVHPHSLHDEDTILYRRKIVNLMKSKQNKTK